MSDRSAQVTQDALSILEDVRQWELSADRWEAIGRVLTAMATALEAGDLNAVADATIKLEVAGPVRLTRIGAPTQPAPAPVRERINQLIHRLSGETEDDT